MKLLKELLTEAARAWPSKPEAWKAAVEQGKKNVAKERKKKGATDEGIASLLYNMHQNVPKRFFLQFLKDVGVKPSEKFRKELEKAVKKAEEKATLKEAAKTGDWKRVKFTEQELVKVFRHFLRYLVQDYGNDRKEMIEYHIKKLVGLPYSQVVKKMPRGPGRGGWSDVMADIKIELEELAKKKAGVPLEEAAKTPSFTITIGYDDHMSMYRLSTDVIPKLGKMKRADNINDFVVRNGKLLKSKGTIEGGDLFLDLSGFVEDAESAQSFQLELKDFVDENLR